MLSRWLHRLQQFAERPWYIALIASASALNAFVFIIPAEALLISKVLLRRKGWFFDALLCAFGAAVGALALAYLIETQGERFISHLPGFETVTRTDTRVAHFVQEKGLLGIGIISLSILPQQPAVALGALAKLPLGGIFAAVFIARWIKYTLYAALASYFPQWLLKNEIIRRHLETLSRTKEKDRLPRER